MAHLLMGRAIGAEETTVAAVAGPAVAKGFRGQTQRLETALHAAAADTAEVALAFVTVRVRVPRLQPEGPQERPILQRLAGVPLQAAAAAPLDVPLASAKLVADVVPAIAFHDQPVRALRLAVGPRPTAKPSRPIPGRLAALTNTDPGPIPKVRVGVTVIPVALRARQRT